MGIKIISEFGISHLCLFYRVCLLQATYINMKMFHCCMDGFGLRYQRKASIELTQENRNFLLKSYIFQTCRQFCFMFAALISRKIVSTSFSFFFFGKSTNNYTQFIKSFIKDQDSRASEFPYRSVREHVTRVPETSSSR